MVFKICDSIKVVFVLKSDVKSLNIEKGIFLFLVIWVIELIDGIFIEYCESKCCIDYYYY